MGPGAELGRFDPGSTPYQQGDPGQVFSDFTRYPARAAQGTDSRLRFVPSKSSKQQHLWKGRE